MTDQDGNPFGTGVIRRAVAAPQGSRAGALVVGAVVPAEELQLHCLMYRQAARDFPGSGEVLFEDEGDSLEEWEGMPRVAGAVSQAERWKRIMQWPRLPSFDEAQQWQQSANAESYNALVDRVQVFRANWAEYERLAKLGGIEFWRAKMSLPPDQRTKELSPYDCAVWLSDVSPGALKAWANELSAKG